MKNKFLITELTLLYYNVISQDYHKDDDCHFEIIQRYSYGKKPIYIVTHYGYIDEIEERSFKSRLLAENYLIKCLYDLINEYYTQYLSFVFEFRDHPENIEYKISSKCIKIIEDFYFKKGLL